MSETIGKGVDRIDGRVKVTGAARFAAENNEKNLVHAVVVPSTVASGTIKTIDTAAAEKAPGVLAVITHRNAPKLAAVKTFIANGAAGESLMPLAGPAIHYAGQHIAVVIAGTFEQATHAASLVKATYEVQKPRTSLERLRGEAVVKGMFGPPEAKRGDADTALGQAAVKVDEVYRTPIEHHNMMEPHAIVAIWNGQRLTVHDSSQYIFGARSALATAFAIPVENVRVMSPYVGGGFGCKGEVWPHVFLAVAAARQVQRPVKLVLTRKQLYTSNGHRSDTEQRVALGASREGKLSAIIHESIGHTSMTDNFVEPCTVATGMMYATPNLRTQLKVVSLNQPTPTFMRAPGETPGMYALESALDELAYKLGLDPVRLRIINHADVDPENGKAWSSKSLKECYEQAGARFGWSKRNAEPRSMRDGRHLIGWGMASATYPTYQWPASARVRILADGSAVVQSGAQEMGMGTATAQSQLAAELLGIPVERIRFELGDTQLPKAPVAGGSAQTASVGSAVRGAAAATLKKLIDMAVADTASPLHGLATNDVASGDGRLFRKSDPSRGETYAAVLNRHYLPSIEASFDASPQQTNFSSHAFGAHFVEVKVDPDLAEVRVQRVISAFAAGRILNAKTARSQYLGGIVQGIGMALMEQTHLDENLARYTNANIAEYLVPVNADIVSIEPILVEEVDEKVNPIGVKGIGEIGIVGVAAAVANAVYHATGRRVRDLPITIEKLL